MVSPKVPKFCGYHDGYILGTLGIDPARGDTSISGLRLHRLRSQRKMQLVYKTRGHPRAKHLVYVVVAGSRATQCRKRGSKRIPSRRETAKNHEKRHAIVFFGAVSSRSGHRSVGYHRPCGRRRSETNAAAEAHGMSVYAWSAFLAVPCIGRISRRMSRTFCCMPSQPPRRAYAGIRQLI